MNIQTYKDRLLKTLIDWDGWFTPTYANKFRVATKECKDMDDLLKVIHDVMHQCIDIDDNGNLILSEITDVQKDILDDFLS
jgi:hypothetical protein